MKERARHNEALDLLDCTQFSDKGKIAVGIHEVQSVIAEATGFSSKKKITHFLLEVQRLKDRLAHGHDLITGTTWESLFGLGGNLERSVQRCEELL